MLSLLKSVIAVTFSFSLLILCGCAEFQSLLHGASNKNAAVQSPAPQEPPKQNCNQWCHNGWCSTHCEPVN